MMRSWKILRLADYQNVDWHKYCLKPFLILFFKITYAKQKDGYCDNSLVIIEQF